MTAWAIITIILVVIQAAAASFVEILLPMTAVAPIVGRECVEAAGSKDSCMRLCQSDTSCHGYIATPMTMDSCSCRFLSFPLCMLQEPVQDRTRKAGRILEAQLSLRIAIKASPYLQAEGAILSYPGYSPVFHNNFQAEFIQREIIWAPRKKYVRSVVSKATDVEDWHAASIINSTDAIVFKLDSELDCTSLCQDSLNQLGIPCGIAFQSTITFINKRVQICRLFNVKAVANIKTLALVNSSKSAGRVQVSDTVSVISSSGIRNDLCLSPIRWNYLRIINDNPVSPVKSQGRRHRRPEDSQQSNMTAADHKFSNSNATNSSDDASNHSSQPTIQTSNFWFRFAFCALIPAGLITIAVFSSAIAHKYNRKQLNGQVAQFWRWERAGIPSDDFRPADDDDDARGLIF